MTDWFIAAVAARLVLHMLGPDARHRERRLGGGNRDCSGCSRRSQRCVGSPPQHAALFRTCPRAQRADQLWSLELPFVDHV